MSDYSYNNEKMFSWITKRMMKNKQEVSDDANWVRYIDSSKYGNKDGTLTKNEFSYFVKNEFSADDLNQFKNLTGDNEADKNDIINKFWAAIDTTRTLKYVQGTRLYEQNALNSSEVNKANQEIKKYEILNKFLDKQLDIAIKELQDDIKDFDSMMLGWEATFKSKVTESLTNLMLEYHSTPEGLEEYLAEKFKTVKKATIADMIGQNYVNQAKQQLKTELAKQGINTTDNDLGFLFNSGSGIQQLITKYINSIKKNDPEAYKNELGEYIWATTPSNKDTLADIKENMQDLVAEYFNTAMPNSIKKIFTTTESSYQLSRLGYPDKNTINDLQQYVLKVKLDRYLKEEVLKNKNSFMYYDECESLYSDALNNYINNEVSYSSIKLNEYEGYATNSARYTEFISSNALNNLKKRIIAAESEIKAQINDILNGDFIDDEKLTTMLICGIPAQRNQATAYMSGDSIYAAIQQEYGLGGEVAEQIRIWALNGSNETIETLQEKTIRELIAYYLDNESSSGSAPKPNKAKAASGAASNKTTYLTPEVREIDNGSGNGTTTPVIREIDNGNGNGTTTPVIREIDNGNGNGTTTPVNPDGSEIIIGQDGVDYYSTAWLTNYFGPNIKERIWSRYFTILKNPEKYGLEPTSDNAYFGGLGSLRIEQELGTGITTLEQLKAALEAKYVNPTEPKEEIVITTPEATSSNTTLAERTQNTLLKNIMQNLTEMFNESGLPTTPTIMNITEIENTYKAMAKAANDNGKSENIKDAAQMYLDYLVNNYNSNPYIDEIKNYVTTQFKNYGNNYQDALNNNQLSASTTHNIVLNIIDFVNKIDNRIKDYDYLTDSPTISYTGLETIINLKPNISQTFYGLSATIYDRDGNKIDVSRISYIIPAEEIKGQSATITYDSTNNKIVVTPKNTNGTTTAYIYAVVDGIVLNNSKRAITINRYDLNYSDTVNHVTGWNNDRSTNLEAIDPKPGTDSCKIYDSMTDLSFKTIYNNDYIIRLHISMDDSESLNSAGNTINSRLDQLGRIIKNGLLTSNYFDTNKLEQAKNTVIQRYKDQKFATGSLNDDDDGTDSWDLTNNLVGRMKEDRSGTGHRVVGTRDDDGSDSWVWGLRFKDLVDDIIAQYNSNSHS